MSAQILAKVCKSDDLVEKLTTSAKFKDDIVKLPRFRKVNELDDAWVVELAHDLHFFEDVCAL
jgi:hypothetical protein